VLGEAAHDSSAGGEGGHFRAVSLAATPRWPGEPTGTKNLEIKARFRPRESGRFEFGGGSAAGSAPGAGNSGDVPTIFYSRRIDRTGRTVPIIGGGRVTGRAGPFNACRGSQARRARRHPAATRTEMIVEGRMTV
jgi:hypothetical protein